MVYSMITKCFYFRLKNIIRIIGPMNFIHFYIIYFLLVTFVYIPAIMICSFINLLSSKFWWINSFKEERMLSITF